MAGETPEVLEFVLNCQICLEPFDQTLRIPRVLPCHHTFCGPCIASLTRNGSLRCPNDRNKVKVPREFPVDSTRAFLVEHKNLFLWKDGASSSLEEACQKHQDEKLKFYCSICKSALCSECAFIEHKNQEGHDIVRLGDVLEQVKREIQKLSNDLQHIQESSLQPRAKMATTSLRETEASFKAAEKEMQDAFCEAAKALFIRQTEAVEGLRSKWRADEEKLKDQAAMAESRVSSAKTRTALGRTVSSVGLPSHIVAQRQELETAVQEARAEGRKPTLPSISYKVNTDLVGLMDHLRQLGTIQSDDPQAPEGTRPEQQRKRRKADDPQVPEETRPEQQIKRQKTEMSPRQPALLLSPAMASPRRPAPLSSAVTSFRQSSPAASAVTSSTIRIPEFQLEPGRCNAGCTLEEDGRTLTNTPHPRSGGTGQSGPRPFAFPGTCGSVNLAQPALHYWTVRCQVVLYVLNGECCEIGLASLQSLQTCGSGERISDHDIQAPIIVMVGEGDLWRLVGRGWTQDVDTPPPPVTSDTPYTCLERKKGSRILIVPFAMTLGFLYDNRQPQSPRVLVVEAESCRLLGVRRVSPSPDLRPVLRVRPRSHSNRLYVKLEVETGTRVLDDVKARKLQSLLTQMTW